MQYNNVTPKINHNKIKKAAFAAFYLKTLYSTYQLGFTNVFYLKTL